MHSAFVIPRYWPGMGGSEQHTRRLAQEIDGKVNVDVISHCSDENMLPEIAYALNHAKTVNDANVTINQVVASGVKRKILEKLVTPYQKWRACHPLYSWLMQQSLSKTLLSYAKQKDILHNVYNGSTATTKATIKAARSAGIPVVFTPLAHTTLPDGTAWSSSQFKKIYRCVDAILTMTEYEKHWLMQQGAREESIHVCPVATDINGEPNEAEFRKKYHLGDHPFVLFLGRLVEHKGYRLLAEAMRETWKQFPEMHVVFVGPGTQASRNYFAENTDPRIHCLGSVQGADKSSALSACEFLCVPSTEESLGVIYLEAWLFKKAVIAVDIPVLRTVIAHGEEGLLVKPDQQSLSRAMHALLSDPAAASHMGLRGYEKVMRNYNWQRIGERLVTIYRGLV